MKELPKEFPELLATAFEGFPRCCRCGNPATHRESETNRRERVIRQAKSAVLAVGVSLEPFIYCESDAPVDSIWLNYGQALSTVRRLVFDADDRRE